MLKMVNLNYHKGFKHILKNINLTINDNSFNIIIGENGCGKTTLLKIITKSIKNKAYKTNFKDVFYLSDKFVLPGNKYVKDFLYMAINCFKCSINIDKIINYLELPNKKIKDLSKGNYKKTALVYSFITGADLIIYDEILDGLDKNVVKKILKYLKTLNKTIIIVTHFLKLFRYFKYNLIELNEGRIVNEEDRTAI